MRLETTQTCRKKKKNAEKGPAKGKESHKAAMYTTTNGCGVFSSTAEPWPVGTFVCTNAQHIYRTIIV